MATRVKAKTVKKLPQPLPEFDGCTPRRCGGCRESIRTRRQTRCRDCKRDAMLQHAGLEPRIAELDARAQAQGYADWYDFTDS